MKKKHHCSNFSLVLIVLLLLFSTLVQPVQAEASNNFNSGCTQQSCTCSLTFKPNGDNVVTSSETTFFEQYLSSFDFSQISFSRSGYYHVQWNTKSDGSGTAYSENFILTVTGDITLYAIWSNAPKITVTFNTDGNGTMKGNTAWETSKGSLLTYFPTVVANDGYQFYGWFADGKDDAENILLLKDTVVTAVFVKVISSITIGNISSYTGDPLLRITFDIGSLGTTSQSLVYYIQKGGILNLYPNISVNEGYVLSAWMVGDEIIDLKEYVFEEDTIVTAIYSDDSRLNSESLVSTSASTSHKKNYLCLLLLIIILLIIAIIVIFTDINKLQNSIDETKNELIFWKDTLNNRKE